MSKCRRQLRTAFSLILFAGAQWAYASTTDWSFEDVLFDDQTTVTGTVTIDKDTLAIATWHFNTATGAAMEGYVYTPQTSYFSSTGPNGYAFLRLGDVGALSFATQLALGDATDNVNPIDAIGERIFDTLFTVEKVRRDPAPPPPPGGYPPGTPRPYRRLYKMISVVSEPGTGWMICVGLGVLAIAARGHRCVCLPRTSRSKPLIAVTN